MTAAGFTDRTVHVNGLRFHYAERHDDQVRVSYGIERSINAVNVVL